MKTLSEFEAAINGVKDFAALDEISRAIWVGLARATFSEHEAEGLSGALEARRAFLKARAANPASGLLRASKRPSSRCTSPDRRRSLERRRAVAASGVLPPKIACHFTLGEQAVLSIIGQTVKAAGRCILPLDAIAAKAGVCRSTAQNALRAAKTLGIIVVTERRFRGRASDFNIVEVSSREWIVWLRLGGTAQRGGDRVQKNERDHYRFYQTATFKNKEHRRELEKPTKTCYAKERLPNDIDEKINKFLETAPNF
jgi:hypothetical protein